MINTRLLFQAVRAHSRAHPRAHPWAHRWVRDAFLVIGASVLIALSAHVKIPLPFTPVPVSMQSFTVLFLAMLLGPRRAVCATLAYIAEGACGLPVFSGGGAGLLYIAGPTGGYLAGFVIAAFLAGWVIDRSQRKGVAVTFSAAFLATAVIYLFGAAWLSRFVGGVDSAIAMGVTPFLIGDGIKLALAVFGMQVTKNLRKHY